MHTGNTNLLTSLPSEDKTWNYDDRLELRKATSDDKYFIKEGYTTASINFDREVRYYEV